jgi:acetyl-CoA carboxylase biotin carboxyl carrier protein
MDLKKIKSLIDLLADSPLTQLELIEGDDQVKLVKRNRAESGGVPAPSREASRVREPQPRARQDVPQASDRSSGNRQDAAPRVVRSPMFGVVHLQASPNDPPFVRIDDVVTTGQALCTIEAMKVFHALESEYDGRIAEVLVTSGDEVEAGQPLFRIE